MQRILHTTPTPGGPTSEKELLTQIASGNEQAFSILFTAWHHKLAGYVLGWTKSLTITEEIVQDIFLKIWLGRNTLKEVQNFDKYLYTISRNHTYNALRSVARERVRFAEWIKHAEADPASSKELLQVPLDYSLLIEAAVKQLPGQQRKVYELKYMQGRKYESIGEELGIAPETARKHMQAATRSITDYLRSHLPILLIILKVF